MAPIGSYPRSCCLRAPQTRCDGDRNRQGDGVQPAIGIQLWQVERQKRTENEPP
jgi:hypothetical protein